MIDGYACVLLCSHAAGDDLGQGGTKTNGIMWFGRGHYQHPILWVIQDLYMGVDDQDFVRVTGT